MSEKQGLISAGFTGKCPVLNLILLRFSTNTINNEGKKKNIKLQFQP